MWSERVALHWTCACSGQNESLVWRTLSLTERPDVAAEPAGLTHVVCGSCGAAQPIASSLLVVRDNGPARVLLALPPGPMGADEPTAALWDLAGRAGFGKPVLLPRALLQVVLGRDVSADLDAEASTWDGLGPLSDQYAQFLSLVRAQETERHAAELLQAMAAVPGERLPGWLRDHPAVHGPEALAVIAHMAEGALAADDRMAGGMVEVLSRLLSALAAGDDPRAAADRYLAEFKDHQTRTVVPEMADLMERADGDPEIAIPALRKLVALDIPGMDARATMRLLGSRLLQSGGKAAIAEAVPLLREARRLGARRDGEWASATVNLAAALWALDDGDVVENWTTVVAMLREALDVEDAGRAVALTNLGLVLSSRPGGSTAEDYAEAVSALEEAARARSPDVDVADWAYSELNLANTLLRRAADGDRRAAAAGLAHVVARLRGRGHDRLLAFACLNRCTALRSRECGDPLGALSLAREGLAAALRLGDGFLTAWAWNRVGGCLAQVSCAPTPAAVHAMRNSVDEIEPTLRPAQFLENAGLLIDAYQRLADPTRLAGVYSRMLVAVDALYAAQTTHAGRRHVLEAHPRLARWAAHALAEAGLPEEAVEALEAQRTRELTAETGYGSADLDALDRVDPVLADAYRTALAAYRSAAAATSGLGPGEPPGSAADAYRALSAVLDTVRAVPGLRGFLVRPPVAELLRTAGVEDAVYVSTTPAGGHVFHARVHRDGYRVEVTRTPGVTGAAVTEVLLVDPQGRPGIVFAQRDADPTGHEVALARAGAILAPAIEATGTYAARTPGPTVLVLAGLLGFLPFLSLPVPGGGTLDDDADLHLAPSLAAYAASAARRGRVLPATLVAVADTDPLHPLPGARAEVARVAGLDAWAAPPRVAAGDDATRAWLALHAPGASHLHLACHGRNDLGDPDGGHVLLGAGQTLGSADLTRLGRLVCRVVVLSACQSGHFDASAAPDEVVGLAGGFLAAGAACVVASLWPVGDDATALLMDRFYELLTADASPVSAQDPQSALRRARLWLRELTWAERDERLVLLGRGGPDRAANPRVAEHPYRSPRHWGAFVAVGC